MNKIILSIDDINIPKSFKKTPPRKKKYIKNLKYYNEFNKFRHNTIVNKDLILVDGYCNYLICKSKNIKEISCFVDKNAYVKGNKIKKHVTTVRRKQISKNMRAKVYSKYNGVCVACGETLQLDDSKKNNYATIDHIKPLSKGGKNSFDNYQLMCKKCNCLKSNIF